MIWQFDWTMWYIGQTQYLGFSESQLSVFNGIFNIGQLFAIGILSKMVQKKGNDYTICTAALGLLFCPISMFICTLLPMGLRMPGLTLLVTVLNASQCAVNLCIVQILLRVSPKEYRSLAVSLYTLTITITNSFMPYLGVRLYTHLGSDYRAFVILLGITAVLRLLALVLFVLRYLYLKKLNPDHKL